MPPNGIQQTKKSSLCYCKSLQKGISEQGVVKFSTPLTFAKSWPQHHSIPSLALPLKTDCPATVCQPKLWSI